MSLQILKDHIWHGRTEYAIQELENLVAAFPTPEQSRRAVAAYIGVPPSHDSIESIHIERMEAALRAAFGGRTGTVSHPVIRDGEFTYEVGWCRQHGDLAKRYEGDYPDFTCWWECTVETSVRHRPEDFVAVGVGQEQ